MIIFHRTDRFLAELGLESSGPRAQQWGDDPDSKILRANLTHPVLQRMLESAEAPAPFLKLSREVVFAMLRDLVVEEPEREPAELGSIRLQDVLAETARLANARHGPPRAPEWAVPLDV